MVAEDGTTNRDYVLVIMKTPSPTANEDFLSSLSITPGSLNETFDSNTFTYTSNVDNSVETVTISGASINQIQ